MPELPEVEVVKRSLTNKIQSLVIKSIIVKVDKLRYQLNKNKLKKLIGLKIVKILRRSKFLIFIFDKDIIMLAHLGMTGKFLFINNKDISYKTSFYYDIDEHKDKKHDRLIFILSKGNKLKSPGIIAFLDKDIDSDFEKAQKIKNNIEYITLRDITLSTKIFYDPFDYNTTIEEDCGFINTYKEFDDIFSLYA